MKLQNLAIIFLVITIPLIVILSYYLSMQQQTLKLQAEYDIKLAEATKEGIKAFEVNTVDWSEWVSSVSSQTTRNNVQAAVNTFITSLANNLHLSGTAKEYMLNYIPAIAVTMYDGYYSYSPTYMPVTAINDNGVQMFYDRESGQSNKITLSSEDGDILYVADVDRGITGQTYTYTYVNSAFETEQETFQNLTTNIDEAKMTYKSILNNKIAYAARYRDVNDKSRTNVVVNYTLDNRIYVYGKVNGEIVDKDGYLIYLASNILPRAHLTIENPKNDSAIYIDNGITGINCDNTEIEPEILQEQVLCKENNQYVLKTYKYLYDITHEKLYYDEIEDNFFTINSITKEKEFIGNTRDIKIGSDSCKYKSISILWGNSDGTTEYKKIYQALNGKDKGKWCISIKPENAATEKHKETIDTEIKAEKLKELGLDDIRFSTIYRDFSAINYYVEAYAFTNWVKQNLGNKTMEIVQKKVDNDISNPITLETNIFNISQTNDPEEETSEIVQHKKEVMRDTVTTNLNLAISNYNGPGELTYKLPQLTESDWEQLFSNISLITFFQGIPIGLKTYNNYAIATSTTNREYVDPGEIYFSGDDINYHRVNCEKCGRTVYTGYRSVEYVQKEFLNGTDNIYYYQHNDNNNGTSRTACYYCAVNKSNYKQTSNKKIAYLQEKSYNEALSRERYYQKQTLDGKIGITIIYDANLAGNEIKEIINIPENQDASIGESTVISSLIPEAKMQDESQNGIYKFVGWSRNPNASDIEYLPSQVTIFDESDVNEDNEIYLYAIWKINLGNMIWRKDYNTSVSTINIGSNSKGNFVHMIGNQNQQGKGAAWTSLTSNFLKITEFSFDYDLNAGHSFNGGGLLFNIKDSNKDDEHSGTLEGYMLSINLYNELLAVGKNNGIAIFKFKYDKGKNFSHFPGTITKRNPSNDEMKDVMTDLTYLGGVPLESFKNGSGSSLMSGRGRNGTGTIIVKSTEKGYDIIIKEKKDAGGYFPDQLVQVEDKYFTYDDDDDKIESQNTFGFFSDHFRRKRPWT